MDWHDVCYLVHMILDVYYLSDSSNHDRASNDLEMSINEISSHVGYFTKRSHRHGQMRGKVVHKINRNKEEVYELRHHFNNKLYASVNLGLWSEEVRP